MLQVHPQHQIYEGDPLFITCTASSLLHGSENLHLYLSQGTRLLSSGDAKLNHSMVALADEPAEFECKLEVGNVVKAATETVAVTGEWTSLSLPAQVGS